MSPIRLGPRVACCRVRRRCLSSAAVRSPRARIALIRLFVVRASACRACSDWHFGGPPRASQVGDGTDVGMGGAHTDPAAGRRLSRSVMLAQVNQGDHRRDETAGACKWRSPSRVTTSVVTHSTSACGRFGAAGSVTNEAPRSSSGDNHTSLSTAWEPRPFSTALLRFDPHPISGYSEKAHCPPEALNCLTSSFTSRIGHPVRMGRSRPPAIRATARTPPWASALPLLPDQTPRQFVRVRQQHCEPCPRT